MIRQLPAGFALVIRGDCTPVVARLPRAWHNRAYRRARRFRLMLPDPVPGLPLAGEPEPDIPLDETLTFTRGDGASFPWS
jgi:hypothetical protein